MWEDKGKFVYVDGMSTSRWGSGGEVVYIKQFALRAKNKVSLYTSPEMAPVLAKPRSSTQI